MVRKLEGQNAQSGVTCPYLSTANCVSLLGFPASRVADVGFAWIDHGAGS
jgi:hypothetical protein